MRTIDGLDKIAITNYHIRRDCVELVGCGSIVTITDAGEAETIKAWIDDIKRCLPNDSARKSRICNYIEYMLSEGQYEEELVYNRYL